MRSLFVVMTLLLVASSVRADTIDPTTSLFSARPTHDPWHINWLPGADVAAPVIHLRSLALPSTRLQDEAQPLHAAAIEHSDAYQTRRKIHKYASFATLPLFAAEVALGQSLYNAPTGEGSKRAAHGIVGAGIVGLFAVNTVTGAWNMFGEDRKDPSDRALRLVHGLLMMAADVGMVATSQSGPGGRSRRDPLAFDASKATHRNMAIVSISVGTAGYLIMLFGRH
jgi:hypothetical protein